MKAQELLDEILPILFSVKDDKDKLQKILDFFYEEIYDYSNKPTPELPEKYQKVVVEIADSIDAGFICFLNLETTEFEELPNEMLFDPEYFEKNTSDYFTNMKIHHHEWEKCVRFEPLESYDSLQLMLQFSGLIPDKKLHKQLVSSLESKNQNSAFNDLINHSEYVQNWVDFKSKYLQNHIADLLVLELEKELPEAYTQMINGYFDEPADSHEPEIIPIPSLCLICKIHKYKGNKENLMCSIKRFDQRMDESFSCIAFEKA